MGKRKSLKTKLDELDTSMMGERDLSYVMGMDDEIMNDLLVSVVSMAWADLLLATDYLRRNPIEDIKTASWRQVDYLVKMNDTRHFFESDWFNDITKGNVNPDWVFDVLEKTLSVDREKRALASNLVKKRLKSAIIY